MATLPYKVKVIYKSGHWARVFAEPMSCDLTSKVNFFLEQKCVSIVQVIIMNGSSPKILWAGATVGVDFPVFPG